MHDLAVAMATDGQPLGHIRELLGVAVGPLDLSVKTVFGDAVEKVVAALRYQLSPLFNAINPLFLIQKGAFSERIYSLHNCFHSISCHLHCLL